MKEDLTKYDILPEDFLNYLRYYGSHFNKKLCEFACKKMNKKSYTKERMERLLKEHGILLDASRLYDHVVLANWVESTTLGSGIPSEKHLVLFVRDVLEKEGHLVFNRWYADMAKEGIPIDWEEMI